MEDINPKKVSDSDIQSIFNLSLEQGINNQKPYKRDTIHYTLGKKTRFLSKKNYLIAVLLLQIIMLTFYGSFDSFYYFTR